MKERLQLKQLYEKFKKKLAYAYSFPRFSIVPASPHMQKTAIFL